jgi:hypothetical protein
MTKIRTLNTTYGYRGWLIRCVKRGKGSALEFRAWPKSDPGRCFIVHSLEEVFEEIEKRVKEC